MRACKRVHAYTCLHIQVCMHVFLSLSLSSKRTHTRNPPVTHAHMRHTYVCGHTRIHQQDTHIRTLVVMITKMRAYSMQICICIHTHAVEHGIALLDLKHIKAPSKHDQNTHTKHMRNCNVLPTQNSKNVLACCLFFKTQVLKFAPEAVHA